MIFDGPKRSGVEGSAVVLAFALYEANSALTLRAPSLRLPGSPPTAGTGCPLGGVRRWGGRAQGRETTIPASVVFLKRSRRVWILRPGIHRILDYLQENNRSWN